MSHQATAAIYKRKLIKSWQATEANKSAPDRLIKDLFRLASEDAIKKRTIKPVMTFYHSLQDNSTKHKQQYRVTNLGRIVLIPPYSFYGVQELASQIMKI